MAKRYPFRRLLIIGSEREIEMGSSRAKGINPKAILYSLAAIEVRGVPLIVFTHSSPAAAILVERWAFWRAHEILKIAGELTRTAKP